MSAPNVGASVRARLLNRARETQQEFNLILTRYAIERLLYRISISPYADQFLAPLGLTETFAMDTQKKTQWQAFLRKNGLGSLDLSEVVAELHAFIMPAAVAAHAQLEFDSHWQAGGPWSQHGAT